MAREDWTFYQNPVDHAAVLIAVEVWKLLDRLGPHGDMQGRIKDFEELSDEERGGAVLKASVLVQAKLSRWPDDGDPLMQEFARATEGIPRETTHKRPARKPRRNFICPSLTKEESDGR